MPSLMPPTPPLTPWTQQPTQKVTNPSPKIYEPRTLNSSTLRFSKLCRSHCRFAKFCGLMYDWEYGDVIGLKEPIAWKCILGTYSYENTRFLTNRSAVFHPIHGNTEFVQTTV
jgi:hypothetical protein